MDVFTKIINKMWLIWEKGKGQTRAGHLQGQHKAELGVVCSGALPLLNENLGINLENKTSILQRKQEATFPAYKLTLF